MLTKYTIAGLCGIAWYNCPVPECQIVFGICIALMGLSLIFQK